MEIVETRQTTIFPKVGICVLKKGNKFYLGSPLPADERSILLLPNDFVIKNEEIRGSSLRIMVNNEVNFDGNESLYQFDSVERAFAYFFTLFL